MYRQVKGEAGSCSTQVIHAMSAGATCKPAQPRGRGSVCVSVCECVIDRGTQESRGSHWFTPAVPAGAENESSHRSKSACASGRLHSLLWLQHLH